jgi:hypothetical protein
MTGVFQSCTERSSEKIRNKEVDKKRKQAPADELMHPMTIFFSTACRKGLGSSFVVKVVERLGLSDVAAAGAGEHCWGR